MRSLSRGDHFRLRSDRRNHFPGALDEVGWQIGRHPSFEFTRERGECVAIGIERDIPFLLERGAVIARVPAVVDVLRNREWRIAPPDRRARRCDLLFPECRAVRGLGSLFGRRALADHRLAADQRRLGRRLRRLEKRRANRRVHRVDIVAVDIANHVPPIRFEALRRIVGKPVPDLAVDRDSVVVIERDQLRQPPSSGERAGFVRDAFHHASIAKKHVGVVIDDCVIGTIELGGEKAFSQRHSDSVRESLSEGTGRRFDAGRDADFRMPGCLRMELAKVFELLHRQVVAGEMQERVLQHRAVAVRQHEAVAIDPVRIRRIVAKVAVPERNGDLRHSHRHSRVSRFCFLDRVHRQRADGIGKQLIRHSASVG